MRNKVSINVAIFSCLTISMHLTLKREGKGEGPPHFFLIFELWLVLSVKSRFLALSGEIANFAKNDIMATVSELQASSFGVHIHLSY